ncbi:ABC transporter substrate-binding protein [Lysinibacillus fusiformis]|uniref:ABC transporter substrate-binding protein n=1 Tax=Lysinibacillus fusiformis TaxID=28031 RepID=UPI003BA2150C
MKKILIRSIILTLLIIVAGCGNQELKASGPLVSNSENNYPITIKNVTKSEGGSEWSAKNQVFKNSPERVLATTRPVAELLLKLGLDESIVGVSANFGAIDDSVVTKFEKLNIISDTYIGKEVAVGTNPDLIIGRGDLFTNGDGRIGTVDSLNSMNINTYVLESSISGATYDTVYNDIENIGRIFNIPDVSTKLTNELKDKASTIKEKLSNIKEKKSFAYIHTNDPEQLRIEAISEDAFFNDAFHMINLENALINEKGDVSLEVLIEADPDIIIIPRWDDVTDLNKVRDEIYKNKKLASIKAIKNKNIHIVDYNYLFGYGYTTIFGMEQLAREVYPDSFK